jgi:hypothetical protein
VFRRHWFVVLRVERLHELAEHIGLAHRLAASVNQIYTGLAAARGGSAAVRPTSLPPSPADPPPTSPTG